jgi:hypothetical protein
VRLLGFAVELETRNVVKVLVKPDRDFEQRMDGVIFVNDINPVPKRVQLVGELLDQDRSVLVE